MSTVQLLFVCLCTSAIALACIIRVYNFIQMLPGSPRLSCYFMHLILWGCCNREGEPTPVLGQWIWAYHSWQYRHTWIPWPSIRHVHMMMFQTWLFRLSLITKLNPTDKQKEGIKRLTQKKCIAITQKFSCHAMCTVFTSNNRKCTEHDRVEEAKNHGQGILVHQSRDGKHTQHGCRAEPSLGQLGG